MSTSKTIQVRIERGLLNRLDREAARLAKMVGSANRSTVVRTAILSYFGALKAGRGKTKS